jgi:hypothetical protein
MLPGIPPTAGCPSHLAGPTAVDAATIISSEALFRDSVSTLPECPAIALRGPRINDLPGPTSDIDICIWEDFLMRGGVVLNARMGYQTGIGGAIAGDTKGWRRRQK